MSNQTGRKFMLRTNLEYQGETEMDRGIPRPPFECEFKQSGKIIDLPKCEKWNVNNVNLIDALENRSSVRDYSDLPFTLEELSFLLWYTQGIKKIIPGIVALRNVPSAGARHAFETYLLINRVEGITPGLYRFLSIDHKLAEVTLVKDLADKFTTACDDQDYVKNSAVAFFWTAMENRMGWAYGERGYRYLHLDAGHVCQNLYLAAEAINSGVCAIGHYYDNQLNSLLKIDGEEQFVIYAATVGKKE